MYTQGHSTQFEHGFTLIELMIVIAILAVLVALAIPAYTDNVRKARRADGIDAITAIMINQGKWRSNNTTYTSTLANVWSGGYGGGANNNTIDGYYTLLTAASSINPGTAFSVTASTTGAARGDQDEDSCGDFILEVAGNQPPDKYTSEYAKGSDGANRCWQR